MNKENYAKEKKVWKILAITFIILFVFETSIVIWLITEVFDDERKEEECLIDVCGYNYSDLSWTKEYDGYFFNSIESFCYCYKNDVVSKMKHME